LPENPASYRVVRTKSYLFNKAMLDCKIYSDAIDFSTEDVTAAVRPSLRIVYNWIDWVKSHPLYFKAPSGAFLFGEERVH
jgi:hypothetical protein